MSITDELRRVAAKTECANGRCEKLYRGDLDQIADRIDAEVEQLREREYQNGREDAGGAVEFADRLCRASERREDVTLWGVDYTALPVDADGVPIHVGDVMEWPYGNGEFRVNGIGGNTLFYIDKDSYECEWTAAGDKRHHHAPTVEDVLEEFVARWMETHHDDIPALKAEYAARLRLAEGVE